MTLPLFNERDIKIRVNDRSTHCCLAVLLKVQSIRDVVCYTKRDVIVGQHTIESRVGCEKIHHLVILNVTLRRLREMLFVRDQQARWNVWKQ